MGVEDEVCGDGGCVAYGDDRGPAEVGEEGVVAPPYSHQGDACG